MNHILAIAAGGALGSVLRFLASSWTYSRLGSDFPYGTLLVNVLGSLVMGFLYTLLVERSALDPIWRAGLVVGVLGGFTTFSAFSMETVNLIAGGELPKALVNILASVGLCLTATWIGVISGRQL